eukprot:14871721-Ditylum_brightwellii.AAC.1
MEKNQETIMTVIQSKNSAVQEQINQLVQSVMVLGNSMKNQQGQVDSLCKQREDESDQLDGVKGACWDSTDGHDDHMDELDNQIHGTQSQGAPLHRDSLATTTKGRRFSWTQD